MTTKVEDRVADEMGLQVRCIRQLAGGQIGSVNAVTLEDGREVVAKNSDSVPLSVEAFMLRYLNEKSSLPVPDVLFASDDLLVLEMVAGAAGTSPDE